jgi:hypothetical protein
MELHYQRFHPNQVIKVQREPGQTLQEIIRNVKIQLNARNSDEPETKPGDIQPDGSNEGAGTENSVGETVPVEPELSRGAKRKSEYFPRKRTNL